MVSTEKIKTSLIEDVGLDEGIATTYANKVMSELGKHDSYEEFYYKIMPNNKIYFFIKKKLEGDSFRPVVLNKEGFNL